MRVKLKKCTASAASGDTHETLTHRSVSGVDYYVKSIFRKDARETAEAKLHRLVREAVSNSSNRI